MDDEQYDSPDGAPAPVTADGSIAKGVYGAGAVRSLMAQGFELDVLLGTSIGALNAAILAQEDAAVLERIWLTVATKPITKLLPQAALLYDVQEQRLASGQGRPNSAGRRARVGGGSLLEFMGAFDPLGAQSVLSILDRGRSRPFMCAVRLGVDRGRIVGFLPTQHEARRVL